MGSLIVISNRFNIFKKEGSQDYTLFPNEEHLNLCIPYFPEGKKIIVS